MAISERSRSAVVQAQGERRARAGIEQLVRFLPIRWRIFSIAALNTAVVLIIAALIWDGAKVLGQAWQEVRHVRQSDQLLALLGGEAGRLQDLIHRYINQPSPEIFGEILLRREALLSTLMSRGSADPMLAGSVGRLTDVTEQFLAGFNDLRAVQSAIADTYQNQILKPSKDMAGLYGLIEAATVSRDDLIWPALGKSHEAFTAALLAANVYYLSPAPNGAEEARSKLASIEQTIPVLVDLARSDLQRNALTVLRERTATFQQGLTELGDKYTTRARLLRDEVDASQAAMIGIIDGLSAQMRVLEQNAQARFDRALGDVYRKVGFVALIFLAFIMLIATAVARSISTPLHQLRDAMFANITGDHQRRVVGTEARDEIGDMARAVEVFRENAIAKGHAEDELRAAKDRAERARADIAAARADAERTREILQTVLDNMNDGVMMFDKHFRWQFVNRQLMTFQRFPAEVCYPGASGYDILRFQAERGDFGPTDDIERTVEERAAVLRNSAGSRYERRTASGRYIEFNFNPIEDGGTLAVYRDITELKDREEALTAARAEAERTREMLQTVLDNMTDCVILFDKDLRWLFVNPKLAEFHRLPDEVAAAARPGASVYDILRYQAERGDFGAADDPERAVRERAGIMTNPAGSRYERRTANGRYVEFNFKPIKEGGTLGVYRDITELKDREEALTAARAEAERTREMLQTVLDNMSDCVILFDKDLRGLFFNPKLAEFLQLPDEVAAAARFGASGYDILRFQAERGDFGVGDDLEQAVRERAAIMTNPAGSRYERRTASGRYVEFNFKPLKEGGTLGVYRDITQIREREEALAAAKEAAEQARDAAERTLTDLRAAQQSLIEAEKLAALGSLVAGVAHEVNNPVGISLTVASSFARRCEVFAEEVREGALRRSRLDDFIEQSRDAAHQLVANLQRAGELIQSFKQVAVDRSHAERRVFDLRESTEQIIVSLRPGLKSLPVTLAVRVPDDITMDSYPGPYGQVLTNLVLNAVAHGFAEGRSGTIVLRARLSDPHHVEITFTDDGAGMTEDIQRHVFDPFFTTRRSQGGTGLGLHIVYNLVTRQLGGRIVLQSSPGRGTTFKITLPLKAPPEVAAEQSPTSAGAARDQPTGS